jgi:hypothetical protein
MFTRMKLSPLAVLAPLCASLLLAACGDEVEVEVDPADSIVSMRLVVGAQTINVTESGVITGGPIVIGGGTTNITATFLDASGNTVAGLGDFELRVTPANTALVTFGRVSAFAGTLTRVAAGSTQLSIQLWHLLEQHADFGPFNIPITVQ